MLLHMSVINGPDRLIESLPLIVIFAPFGNNIQTLKYIDDIIDPPPFHPQLHRNLIQLNNIIALALKMLNKLLRQLLQTFRLSIISEDSFIHERRRLFFSKTGT